MSREQYVYFFGGGKAEGRADMKPLLGGKGANLAEMTKIGIPVPPGFTISTEVCDIYYQNSQTYPGEIVKAVEENLDRLEKEMGKKLGDPKDPLLVSVRSGAAVSMPGMMDTVLNLGLSDAAVDGLTEKSGSARFAWDAYRRFMQMYGDVVRGVDAEEFVEALEEIKKAKGVENDTDLDTADLKKVVEKYKQVYRNATGEDFPQDPKKQLWGAIDAVFGSWNNPRAIKYRNLNKIQGLIGTAVNVQSMVFGNFGDTSGTGVCFTRDPSTGENKFYGEFLMNAQGEDVVAGIRTPMPLQQLADQNKEIYEELVKIRERLENHYGDMQDIEFTIQDGSLYLLQTRTGKRTGLAAVRIAVELVQDGKINKEEALMRVTPEQIDQLLHPMIDPKEAEKLEPVAQGLNASPGAACGKVVFTADEAEEWVKRGEKVVLVRRDTSPEDIGGMNAAEGILTSTGGMTSHAAVVARGMGAPCVAGCRGAEISGKSLKMSGKTYGEGDFITIDGTSGKVYDGQVPLIKPELSGNLNTVLQWADDVRKKAERPGLKKGFTIKTNADLPQDAAKGRQFGAEGIGLCRTEHMFFEAGKLEIFQQMIVAHDLEARKKALAKLMPLQKEDFKGIFQAMDDAPVTVRLLDPPLHEFVPRGEEGIKDMAGKLGRTYEELTLKIQSLHELNPMLGHRGCRLGITYPEIYDMQVEAIIRAAAEVAEEGTKVFPEIMIPLVGTAQELETLRANAEKVIETVEKDLGKKVPHKIGTMIEIPRAALTAEHVAKHADFFSFGTNDLTQMTFGYSRDDVNGFMPDYLEQKMLHDDPFQVLDQHGVGELVKLAMEKGRSAKKDLYASICGEHGGDPSSIDFVYRQGLNAVSCSPYRVPVARLAAAQAVIRNQ